MSPIILVLILLGVSFLLILINLVQLVTARRKKRLAEKKLVEIEGRIRTAKQGLEKQKAELSERIRRRISDLGEIKK